MNQIPPDPAAHPVHSRMRSKTAVPGRNETKTSKAEVTRGYGLLERFLAVQRANLADRLIPASARTGRLLDIGCGTTPLFLMNIAFSEKFGLDKIDRPHPGSGSAPAEIILRNHDMEADAVMPFENDYFDAVTMLAVFEHVNPECLPGILNEIYRILKPGGMYLMTTPASWADRLLRIMARLGLVSPVEYEEHKAVYTHPKIASIVNQTKFSREELQLGYFELFMNIWVTAVK